jgi:predicted esterase
MNSKGVRLDEVMSSVDHQFFAYYDPRDAASVLAAQDDMLDLLSTSDYDAVLGFSEGAAFASSLMVRHAEENKLSPPLFSCAVFISGIPPLRVSGLDEPMLRRRQREIDGVLIHVPTLHIVGETDPWRPSNESLFGLCADALATRMEHPGGHVVPKSPRFTSEMVQGIRDIVARARLRQ